MATTATKESTALDLSADTAKHHQYPVVADSGGFSALLDSQKFEHMQRVSTLFAKSKMVPAHFQNDMPSTFVAIQMAVRLGIDPFMFMQNAYMVHGRPGLEAKMVIALVNQRGPFEGPIQWKWSGKEKSDDWTCTAYATHAKTGQKCEASVSWSMVKAEGWLDKSGSKWKTMPQLMFQYRSATFLARLYCPEVIMGMDTIDELHDITPQVSVSPSTPADGIYDRLTSGSEGDEPYVDMADLHSFEKQAQDAGLDPEDTALAEFVAAMAGHFESTPDQVKAEAAQDFDGFLSTFKAWRDKHGKTPGNGSKPSADKPAQRGRRANKAEVPSTGDEINTYGVTGEAVDYLNSAYRADAEAAETITEYLEQVGVSGKDQPVTWLTKDEGEELVAKCKEILGQTPTEAPPTGPVACPNNMKTVEFEYCQKCKDFTDCPERN
jgi:hypothetical protein